jgi:outer membrane immunogenic protein
MPPIFARRTRGIPQSGGFRREHRVLTGCISHHRFLFDGAGQNWPHVPKETTMNASITSMALIAAISSPAFAGGPSQPVPDPVLAPAPVAAPARTDGEWGGAYFGAQLGYGNVDSNGGGLSGDGILGGVHAGYRYDFGTAVVGGEIDYDTSGIDLGATAGNELESVARLKLMAGADLGRILVYGTAGLALAEARVGAATLSDNGWFAGLGADYALTDRWSVGGEVLTHKFDDFDGSGVDLDVNTVKAKVSFSF